MSGWRVPEYLAERRLGRRSALASTYDQQMPLYRETFQVRCPSGIHGWTLQGLSKFGRHGLRVQGINPADMGAAWPLTQRFRDGSQEVEVTVEHADLQFAEDVATIARETIWRGRELWPGRELPLDQFHRLATAIRQARREPDRPFVEHSAEPET